MLCDYVQFCRMCRVCVFISLFRAFPLSCCWETDWLLHGLQSPALHADEQFWGLPKSELNRGKVPLQRNWPGVYCTEVHGFEFFLGIFQKHFLSNQKNCPRPIIEKKTKRKFYRKTFPMTSKVCWSGNPVSSYELECYLWVIGIQRVSYSNDFFPQQFWVRYNPRDHYLFSTSALDCVIMDTSRTSQRLKLPTSFHPGDYALIYANMCYLPRRICSWLQHSWQVYCFRIAETRSREHNNIWAVVCRCSAHTYHHSEVIAIMRGISLNCLDLKRSPCRQEPPPVQPDVHFVLHAAASNDYYFVFIILCATLGFELATAGFTN